jgi:hypothetical protein
VCYGRSDAPTFASLERILKAGGGLKLKRTAQGVLPAPAAPPAAVAAGSSRRKSKGAASAAKVKAKQAPASSDDASTANLAIIGPDKAEDDK